MPRLRATPTAPYHYSLFFFFLAKSQKSLSNSSSSHLPIFAKYGKTLSQRAINARSALTPHRGNSRAADPSRARAQASLLAPFVFPRVFFFPRRPDLDLIHEGERRPSPRRQGRWRPPRPAAARIASGICSIFARFRPDLADVRIG